METIGIIGYIGVILGLYRVRTYIYIYTERIIGDQCALSALGFRFLAFMAQGLGFGVFTLGFRAHGARFAMVEPSGASNAFGSKKKRSWGTHIPHNNSGPPSEHKFSQHSAPCIPQECSISFFLLSRKGIQTPEAWALRTGDVQVDGDAVQLCRPM